MGAVTITIEVVLPASVLADAAGVAQIFNAALSAAGPGYGGILYGGTVWEQVGRAVAYAVCGILAYVGIILIAVLIVAGHHGA